jgi:hypothetical protein
MSRSGYKSFSWDFFAGLLMAVYASLALARWPFLPQFIDMYYHLHTAWAFLQAGGYSGWDFWQYAPFGRTHIYPPLFHLALAFFIKLGANKIFLAKIFEALTPTFFLLVVWYFVARNFSRRLAFFVVLAFGSSFSFFLSLINNIPATLAIIFGILALDCLWRGRPGRAALLLTLAYYTHIASPWFIALTIVLYGLFDRRQRKAGCLVVLSAIILALPVILKQLAALSLIQLADMPDRYFCEFKPLDYALAFFGLILASRRKGTHYLFISLFLAGFIFILYPYRFFSAQGFLPVIFLSAISLDRLYEKCGGSHIKATVFFILGGFLTLIFSPTILTEKRKEHKEAKIYLFDSSPRDLLFPWANERIASTSLWHPEEYLQAVRIIRQNSLPNEIIYANYHILSACLASLSDRPNASALFPEIDPVRSFSPFGVARIIVLTKDNRLSAINYIVGKYKLRLLGENKLLMVFSNPSAKAGFVIPKATVPFWAIGVILLLFSAIFMCGERSQITKNI